MSTVPRSLVLLRRIARSACFATLGFGTHLSIVCASDCNSCDEANCYCRTLVIDLPTAPCLGNGLFDHFNRFADQFSKNKTACRACDANSCDGNCSCQSVSNQLMPNYSARTESDYQNVSRYQPPMETPSLPLTPMPMPMPNAAPSIDNSIKSVPKAGNPFTDEARSKPKRSHLPSSIGHEEVHVMKMNSRLAELMNPSRSKAIAKKPELMDEPSVITVGGTLPAETQFAR